MRFLFKENNHCIRICYVTDYSVSLERDNCFLYFKYDGIEFIFKYVNDVRLNWATIKSLANFESIDLTIGWERIQ